MKFCPTCDYYLYLDKANDDEQTLSRVCRNCGYRSSADDENGGLVMETIIQEKASEAYKVFLNEFTKNDPTLPHLHTLACPNKECATNTSGVQKDVVYIKYDPTNLKFLYICNVCDEKWKSR
jgi:DNA-directed RNA polymerase subunit M/transcription elongation factor TFIIS